MGSHPRNERKTRTQREKVREIDSVLFMPAICLYTKSYCVLGKEVGGRRKGKVSHLGSYWGQQSSYLCNQ